MRLSRVHAYMRLLANCAGFANEYGCVSLLDIVWFEQFIDVVFLCLLLLLTRS